MSSDWQKKPPLTKSYQKSVEAKALKDLEKAFVAKEVHPADLKQATAKYINSLIEPVRKHFEKGKAKELLLKVMSYGVTR